MWYNILTGAVAGLVFGIVGYLRNRKDQEFAWAKLVPTVILSAIAGGVIGYSGVVPDESSLGLTITSLTAIGIDQFIEKLFKAAVAGRSKKK